MPNVEEKQNAFYRYIYYYMHRAMYSLLHPPPQKKKYVLINTLHKLDLKGIFLKNEIILAS